MIVLHVILLITFTYLAVCTAYNLVFAIAGAIGKKSRYTSVQDKKRFAIVIPAYKEDGIIIHTVKNALTQDYPADKFDIVVIADSLALETIAQIEMLPVRVIKVCFEKSTKAKSLKYALQQLPEDRYQIIMILDADNLLGKGCLEKTNHAFSKGFKMVQLHRTAKNKNTATAILDAISEEIGNTILRKGHRTLGLSASLIGSGMAFDYLIFKSVMTELNMDDNPAEDREINTEMLRRKMTCEYIDNAFVFDEKVQSNNVLERQRVRWISAQMSYIRRFWLQDPIKTLTFNRNYTDYALQTLILPRSIVLVLNFVFLVVAALLLLIGDISLYPGILLWTVLFIGLTVSLIAGIGETISLAELKRAFLSFPVTFWSFCKALMQSSSKQKDFIHTPKEYMEDYVSHITEE